MFGGANPFSQGKASLKPTATNDQSAPDVAGALAKASAEKSEKQEYVDSWMAVNAEEWLDELSDLTFKSITVPLSKSECRVFVDNWQILSDPMLARDVALARSGRLLQEGLADLEVKVQEAIDQFGGAAFVKCSSRSPKDATSFEDRIAHQFAELCPVQAASANGALNACAGDINAQSRVCLAAMKAPMHMSARSLSTHTPARMCADGSTHMSCRPHSTRCVWPARRRH